MPFCAVGCLCIDSHGERMHDTHNRVPGLWIIILIIYYYPLFYLGIQNFYIFMLALVFPPFLFLLSLLLLLFITVRGVCVLGFVGSEYLCVFIM